MTNLEIAQKIANRIESSSQEEIDAMIAAACATHGVERGWLFRAVSNLYMQSQSYKPASIGNAAAYSESDPR